MRLDVPNLGFSRYRGQGLICTSQQHGVMMFGIGWKVGVEPQRYACQIDMQLLLSHSDWLLPGNIPS